jgi:hypothetical protein
LIEGKDGRSVTSIEDKIQSGINHFSVEGLKKIIKRSADES